jgi:hypothetical protein
MHAPSWQNGPRQYFGGDGNLLMAAKLPVNVIGAAMYLCASAAIAGPPMVTDDTGTALPGVLEVIVYAAGESRDAGESMQGPALDFAYGLTDELELSLLVPRQRVKNTGEASVRGWGEATAGLKWRFLEGENSALAVAPSLSVPLSQSSTIIGLVEDTTVFTLPVLASVSLGRWEFAGNLGYSIGSRNLDAVSLGASTGYALTPDLRLLGEVWGVDFVDDGASEGFLNWRTGIEWGIGGSIALLAAVGGNIWSQLDSADELNHDYYIGLQYSISQ